MNRLLLIAITLTTLISCEKKISKAEYDYLYDKYVQKSRDILNLQTECEAIEQNISDLQEEERKARIRVNRIEDRIQDAIDAAEECEDYYDELENDNVVYDYRRAETVIKNLQHYVDICSTPLWVW